MRERIWGYKAVAGLWFAVLMFMGVAGYYYSHHPQPAMVQAASSYNPRQPDPCAQNLRVVAMVNLTASGQIVTGTAGKQTYVCSMMLSNATAQNVAIVEGTGSVCATNTVAMMGGNTAATGLQLATTQTVWIDSPGWWALATATTGDNICLLLSSTTQLSGFIQYAQQ